LPLVIGAGVFYWSESGVREDEMRTAEREMRRGHEV
jgi:hypothetical protein